MLGRALTRDILAVRPSTHAINKKSTQTCNHRRSPSCTQACCTRIQQVDVCPSARLAFIVYSYDGGVSGYIELSYIDQGVVSGLINKRQEHYGVFCEPPGMMCLSVFGAATKFRLLLALQAFSMKLKKWTAENCTQESVSQRSHRTTADRKPILQLVVDTPVMSGLTPFPSLKRRRNHKHHHYHHREGLNSIHGRARQQRCHTKKKKRVANKSVGASHSAGSLRLTASRAPPPRRLCHMRREDLRVLLVLFAKFYLTP